MSAFQRDQIVNPPDGLMVFCNDCGNNGTGALCVYLNGSWMLVSLTACYVPAPAGGVHVPEQTAINWHWNAVPGALGYKWNFVNDYYTATEMGTETTKAETGLTCNTSYTRYVWAYSACGNSNPVALVQSTTSCDWVCGLPMTDTRDNKIYNTVQIDAQCWMAQNLNTGTRIISTLTQTDNGIIEKYCNLNLEQECDIYGGLYLWWEAMGYDGTAGGQGICPAGWHIPTITEWNILIAYLGGASVTGGKVKETGLTHWAAPNTGATNSSGFTALPSGLFSQSNFYAITTQFYGWTSTFNGWVINGILLKHDSETLTYMDFYPDYGLAVRCVKN
jgi:uncharacterized protein (TIGR02145 family)